MADRDDDLARRVIGAYLDAVGSAAPTPGGGSVGGVVAALGAALGEMVCALSAGTSGAAGDELAAATERLHGLRARAVAVAADDERAYAAYRAAVALPKGTEEQRAIRRERMQAALRAATEAPLALAEAATDVLATLEPVARVGTPHALADARLAAYLAHAALKGALLNIRGNASMLREADAARRYLAAADRLERDANAHAEAVERSAEVRSG